MLEIQFVDYVIFNLAFQQVVDYPRDASKSLSDHLGVQHLAELRNVYNEIYLVEDQSNFDDCCVSVPFQYDWYEEGQANSALIEIQPDLSPDNSYINTVLLLLIDDIDYGPIYLTEREDGVAVPTDVSPNSLYSMSSLMRLDSPLLIENGKKVGLLLDGSGSEYDLITVFFGI